MKEQDKDKVEELEKLGVTIKKCDDPSEYLDDSSYESVNEDCLNLIRLLVSIIKRMKCAA